MMLLVALALAAVAAPNVPHIERLGAHAAVLVGTSCNVVIVDAPDGLLLVDDQGVLDYAETIGLLKQRYAVTVTQVVNTHFHLDHAGGNAMFARDGATIIGQSNVAVRLGQAGLTARYLARFPGGGTTLAPSRTFADTLRVHFGTETLRLVHVANAHTDGDTLVKLERANVLHMGDVFFNGLYPHIDTDAGGTIQSNIRAIHIALRMTDARTRIIPGHGPIATRTELAAYGRMLEEVSRRVRLQIAAGHDLKTTLLARLAASYALTGDEEGFVTAVYQGMAGL